MIAFQEIGPKFLAMIPWFAAQLALVLLIALAAGRGWGRAAMCLIFFLVAAMLPWFGPAKPVPRVFLSFIAILSGMKALQIATDPAPWAAWRRAAHMLVPFDTREIIHSGPAFDGRILANVVIHGLIGTGLFAATAWRAALPAALRAPALYLCFALLACAWVEVGMDLPRFLFALAGLKVPPVQHAPLLSRSLGEFWGQRWNRPVHAWLARFAFRPLARRGQPALGILSAFAVSGILHAWMVASAMPWRGALSLLAFFLVQGAGALLEARLRVSRWPTWAARAWTLAVLLGAAPLFLRPFLGILGM